jgi:hypothetical protein
MEEQNTLKCKMADAAAKHGSSSPVLWFNKTNQEQPSRPSIYVW